jgi:hypothetical protein
MSIGEEDGPVSGLQTTSKSASGGPRGSSRVMLGTDEFLKLAMMLGADTTVSRLRQPHVLKRTRTAVRKASPKQAVV